MPTYQYACSDCGHRFDAVQKFTDDSLTVCPECGGVLRKVYGSVGVVFKGSGWYRTDSRSGPPATVGKAEAGAAKSDSGAESKSSSSSDAGSASGSGSGSSSGSDSAAKSAPSAPAGTPSSAGSKPSAGKSTSTAKT